MPADRDTLIHGLALQLGDTPWGTPEAGAAVRNFLIAQLQQVGVGAFVAASPIGQVLGLQPKSAQPATACLRAILDCDDAAREAVYREAWELANSAPAGPGPAAGEGAVFDAMILEGLHQLKVQLGGAS